MRNKNEGRTKRSQQVSLQRLQIARVNNSYNSIRGSIDMKLSPGDRGEKKSRREFAAVNSSIVVTKPP